MKILPRPQFYTKIATISVTKLPHGKFVRDAAATYLKMGETLRDIVDPAMDFRVSVRNVIRKIDKKDLKRKSLKNNKEITQLRNTATRKAKDLTEFLSWVGQLEPIEFTGILKIMSVQILQDEKKPRPYEDLLSDLIDRFVEMEKKRRKELIKLVKLTVK